MNCIIIGDKTPQKNKMSGWYGSKHINKTRTLLDNQISVLRKIFPGINIYYVYGFDSKKTEQTLARYDLNYYYNEFYSTTGESTSIKNAIEHINESSLIMSGDIILRASYFQDFDPAKSLIYVDTKSSGELGCTINNQDKVQYMSYDLNNQITNMFYLNTNSIKMFCDLIARHEHRNYFLFEIINKMIDEKLVFYAKNIKCERFNVTTKKRGKDL